MASHGDARCEASGGHALRDIDTMQAGGITATSTGISRGVQGGLALPADEAMLAETPVGEATIDILTAPAPQPHNTQRLARNTRGTIKTTKFSEGFTKCPNGCECGDGDAQGGIHVLDWDEDEAEILLNEPEIEVVVTMDSGSIVNVIHPEDLPSGCRVEKKPNSKNFVGANGGSITNHGVTDTQMTPETGNGQQVRCRWDCAEVTRPLISTGVTCDSGYEVLHTATEACVVPQGTLSRYLGTLNVVQRYTRKGKGLYTTRMKMKAPKSGFTRPSTTQ